MKQHDNENDPLTFVTLAALTANVTRYLQKQKKEDGSPNPEAGNANEKQRGNDLEKVHGGLTDSERRAYVRQSVERIARFENRAKGKRRI